MNKSGLKQMNKTNLHRILAEAGNIFDQKDGKPEITLIDITDIDQNPYQPRKIFEDDSLIALADSIKQYGIISPLLVKKSGSRFQLIAGERRLRAAKLVAFKSVPCIIFDSIGESRQAELSLIENIQRENLNIFEQAQAIEALVSMHKLTQEQVAQKLSMSQSAIANKLRLLRFDADERDEMIKNSLSERHARALLKIFEPDLRRKIMREVISKGLNVAETEEFIEDIFKRRAFIDRETVADTMIQSVEQRPIRKIILKDIKIFTNTIEKAAETVKLAGYDVDIDKEETEEGTLMKIYIKSCTHN
ncbi:MAG: ParB/RepB/Spo0J family partition protein [Oscillospiraceae bacterium]|nr:ParB/RepB/Spo0J family partition protein [Oscillospiraceae bacterium]